jgi:hypothetical protein
MENISNISSEEELLQLRNEGKISEDEYKELLESMRKTSKADISPVAQEQSRPVRTCGLAIASLIFALIFGPFGLIPAAICGHLALRKIEKDATLGGRGLALAGLIVGYSIFGLTIVLSIPILVPVLVYRSAAMNPPGEIVVTEIRQYTLDNTEGLITQSGANIDKQISSDGNGSLRIEATEPITISLFDTGDIDIENARLIYQAQIRTQDLDHDARLEMWCHFPGKGDFFSRDPTAVWGTTAWTRQETIFFLKNGENPDNVRLNLTINGRGTVWIDDIRLLKGALE